MRANAKIPASVTKYLSSMLAALGKFDTAIEGQPAKAQEAATVEYKKSLAGSKGHTLLLASAAATDRKWRTLVPDIKKVEAAPTIAMVTSTFAGDNAARGVATAAKLWDQILVKEFPTTAKKIFSGNAVGEYVRLPFMSEVANAQIAEALDGMVKKSGMAEDRLVTIVMLKFSASVIKSHEMVVHLQSLEKAFAGI